ncbi:hypothetical protein Ancab_026403 [Ancistrocladus abbreviatus]
MQINIWDDRKVFGSLGHILKEEFAGRQSDGSSKNGRQFGIKLVSNLTLLITAFVVTLSGSVLHISGILLFVLLLPVGNTVDKIVSGYEVIYGGHLDEDVVGYVVLPVARLFPLFPLSYSPQVVCFLAEEGGIAALWWLELQRQHAVPRECIQQLTSVEGSRATLVSHLREALHEQAGRLQSEQAANVCRQLLNSGNVNLLDDEGLQEPCTAMVFQVLCPVTENHLVR